LNQVKRASHFVKIVVACPHRLAKLPESTQCKQAIPNKGSLFYSHCGLFFQQKFSQPLYGVHLFRPLFSTLTVAQLSTTVATVKLWCQMSYFLDVICRGPFSPNGVFYRIETLLYTSWNLYFIKQHHQIATIDIQKVWHLLSKFHSCNCCDSCATVRVEKYSLNDTLATGPCHLHFNQRL
jgi:hypothetical protein